MHKFRLGAARFALGVALLIASAAGMRQGEAALAKPAPTSTGAPAASVPGAKPDATTAIPVTRRTYDLKAILASAQVTPEVYRGRAIWQQRCAFCHDGVGQPSYKTMGPWISAETLDRLTVEGFKGFVQGGTERMPGFIAALDDKQIADLTAFVKTIGPDQKPSAAQLAGKAPGGTGD